MGDDARASGTGLFSTAGALAGNVLKLFGVRVSYAILELADARDALLRVLLLGAAALDLCLVASGALDGYVDCAHEAHGGWDYMASTHICREAGAQVIDLHYRDLVVLEHSARRTPIAAATPIAGAPRITIV